MSNIGFPVPGGVIPRDRRIFSGCQTLEAVLQSTLACLYNQNCINEETSSRFNSYNISLFKNSALKITYNGSNETYETVESIVNRLMVNTWLTNFSFSSYYKACAPSSCVFEYKNRRNIYFIILGTTSILGGLFTLLKIFTLIILRFIEKMTETHSQYDIGRFVRRLFVCHTDIQISNRLRLMILLVLIIGFSLVFFIPTQIISVEITKPSFSTYNTLLKDFPHSLQCVCSNIAINYHTFVDIQAEFHPICSSHFMSNDWIRYNYNKSIPFGRFNYTDFRFTAVGQFQLLNSFCELSKKTVDDEISQLHTTSYIDTQLISTDLLDNRIQNIIDAFQLRVPTDFLGILNLIREITQANHLMTMYFTNWKYRFDYITVGDLTIWQSFPLEYGGCNCGLTSKCSKTSRGMRVGCYPLEALLQSTLQCFYDQQCIDSNHTFKALNSSSMSTTFSINSTIETILQKLMVERYSINKSYENYFTQCAPSSCTYYYNDNESVINIIVDALGLYSGLVIISNMITALIIVVYRRHTRRINPSGNMT